MIDLHDVTKTYHMGTQELNVLKGVSLTIEQGEYIAIVGPSGSGKSTLMNIIGCLDTMDSGTYTLEGTDVSAMSDDELARVRSRHIGFVFQQFNLLARTSAVKQVALPLMYQGVSRPDRNRRAEEILTKVGLGDRMHHRPDELSGGQQQRVAIARALVVNPTLILADEPTGNLDSASGADILTLFDSLHEQGITIVTVTHSEEVAEHTRRTVMIRDGLIISDKRHNGKGNGNGH
jgi:putative ABC transport system ATP-binding protein